MDTIILSKKPKKSKPLGAICSNLQKCTLNIDVLNKVPLKNGQDAKEDLALAVRSCRGGHRGMARWHRQQRRYACSVKNTKKALEIQTPFLFVLF